jgi:PPIC-type PPIASE domain
MATESRRAGRALLREPFLHFTLIGGLIFGGHYLFAKPAHSITVSPETQAELAALFEQRQGRKPEPKERAELVERYVDDEVLFREGLARGLVLEDPGVREQVVARMRSVLQGSLVPATPSDRELEAFYEAHRERYALPTAVSFTEYVLPGETDEVARALADALRAGTPVSRAPRVHRERSMVQLKALYDSDVASRIFSLPVGDWAIVHWNKNPRVIRVNARRPGSQRPFEEAMDLVRADYESERTQTGVHQAMKELRTSFSVNVEGS